MTTTVLPPPSTPLMSTVSPATTITAMPQPNITVLLSTFPGLGLPSTVSIPYDRDASIRNLYTHILSRLPAALSTHHILILTTASNQQLLPSQEQPVSSLLSSNNGSNATILSLRLSARLCGGKGGFGSQLRAAGGKMSSRKNRNNANPNGSNRNLDGRRLRTVDEAKRLAEYLATKPEMEKKEREENRKRWEGVVEMAERREEEIKAGKTGANQGRLAEEYVNSKEAAEEKTREAVLRAMKDDLGHDLLRTGSESSASAGTGEGSAEDAEAESGDSEEPEKEGGKTFFGWDEEDEDMSDDEDEPAAVAAEADALSYEGNGKAKA